MGKIVPIRFVDRQGRPALPDAKHPSDAIPVMDVIARFEPEWPAQPLQAHETTVLALVDTGADVNVCTAEIIAATGAPKTGSIDISSTTSTIHSSRHYFHLIFPTARTRIEMDTDIAPLREQGRCYDIIIGRSTLRAGKLVMDYPKQRFYWELPG